MIQLQNISKDYFVDARPVHALNDISIEIKSGDFIAITGPSGAGKSTLMSIIGCLDSPSQGTYLLNTQKITLQDSDTMAAIRRQQFGFVFQSFNLIPRLNVYENVELPMVYAGVPKNLRMKRSKAILKALDIDELMERHPNQLSGGQQQRVAIARSLVNNPPVIIADEPTGNLDSHLAEEIIYLFEQLNKAGKTILYVTHDKNLVKHANRVIRVESGKVRDI